MDDAAGEAFDKTAKLLGLAYPGGPNVEAAAAHGNAKRYALPRPLLAAAQRRGFFFFRLEDRACASWCNPARWM